MGIFVTLILFILAIDPGQKESKIVLLDNNKIQNEITVTTQNGKETLNVPNTFTTVSSNDKKPSKIKKVSSEELEKEYGSILNKNVTPPISMLFYFHSGNTQLTEESKLKLKDIALEINKRIPCDVSIIGHSDRQGDDELNIKLSLKRADFIYEYVKSQDLNISNITIKSFGEKDPIVPTADGVAEPKNRRVEILIR